MRAAVRTNTGGNRVFILKGIVYPTQPGDQRVGGIRRSGLLRGAKPQIVIAQTISDQVSCSGDRSQVSTVLYLIQRRGRDRMIPETVFIRQVVTA